MRIQIQTIPHDQQRYPTCGDYWEDDQGTWQFRISNMNNWKYEMLVAIHELVEWTLVRHAGVSMSVIDWFDNEFERTRPEGNTDEPGDHPSCPYRMQHLVATGVEKIVAALLGVSWMNYDATINAL